MDTVITRKIKIGFVAVGDQRKEYRDRWFNYMRICHKAANMISSHQYIQDRVKELFYFSDGTKVKLGNAKTDEFGILSTTRENSTYQALTKQYNTDMKGAKGMLGGLNRVVSKAYRNDVEAVNKGERSLRSYKLGIPMPVRRADINDLKKQDDGNYTFNVYNTTFKTYFGRDASGNENLIDRAISGDCKLCDSSIQLKKEEDGWNMYLLAHISVPQQQNSLDANKEAVCMLDPEYPIKIDIGKGKFHTIGTKDEYLYRRLAIRSKIKKLQEALKYANGGKGRKAKLQALDKYKEIEIDYINTKMHQYSRFLIDYCVKNGIGTIVLKNYEEQLEISKAPKPSISPELVGIINNKAKTNEPLFRSWSFSELKSKIIYKAAMAGIEVLIPEAEIKEAA